MFSKLKTAWQLICQTKDVIDHIWDCHPVDNGSKAEPLVRRIKRVILVPLRWLAASVTAAAIGIAAYRRHLALIGKGIVVAGGLTYVVGWVWAGLFTVGFIGLYGALAGLVLMGVVDISGVIRDRFIDRVNAEIEANLGDFFAGINEEETPGDDPLPETPEPAECESPASAGWIDLQNYRRRSSPVEPIQPEQSNTSWLSGCDEPTLSELETLAINQGFTI